MSITDAPRLPEDAITITLDTSVDAADLVAVVTAIEGRPSDIRYTSVTGRENPALDGVSGGLVMEGMIWGESSWGGAVYQAPVPESFVLDESRLDGAVLAGDTSWLEQILEVVSSRSFPKRGERGDLSSGERHHLRDAMILEAHAREGRDVFVTKDERGFIRDGRRERLEGLLQTRIYTPGEFCDSIRGGDRS